MSPEEFNRIWMPLSGGFYRVAYYILESREDAEDAVQDLYIRIWKGGSGEISNPKSYGLAVLRNLCIDRIRRRTPDRAVSLDAETAVVLEDSGQTPDKEVMGKEEMSRVLAVMETLPAKQAEIMRMRFIEDLDYEEISERTGLTQQNIRVVVSNARKVLKQAGRQ